MIKSYTSLKCGKRWHTSAPYYGGNFGLQANLGGFMISAEGVAGQGAEGRNVTRRVSLILSSLYLVPVGYPKMHGRPL